MRDYESSLLATVDSSLAAIRARNSVTLEHVRRDLADGLRLVVNASFEQRTSDYAADLATMNSDPLWVQTKYHQSAAVRPKYFGGNPSAIVPNRYVLHISLNHRLLEDVDYPEYKALYSSATHFETCANFFLGEHYYERSAFFPSRAKVLRAWGRDTESLTNLSDRHILNSTSLFVESLPTWSKESTAPSVGMPTNFCLALNERARRFLLLIAPPSVILIAGDSARGIVNGQRIRTDGELEPWRGACVPKSSVTHRKFRVARNAIKCGPHTIPVVRCGFLKTQSGVNSDEELRVLGRILAGDDFDPSWRKFHLAE